MGAEVDRHTLLSVLEVSTQRYPRRTALFYGWKSYSYRALDKASNRWAQYLRDCYQIGTGDRVALLLKNCPEYVMAAFGILKLGAVIVPINNFLKAQEIQYILDDARVRLVITNADLVASVTSAHLIAEDPAVESALRNSSSDNLSGTVQPGQDAVIIYTSGTTGKPKGAVLTHNNIASNVEASVKCINVNPSDRFLLVLPMFHSFTFTVCIMMPLFAGAAVIIVASVQPFSRVLRNMILRGATLFAAVPQIFQVLSTTKIPRWLRPFIRLRLCISGAAALPMATLEAFEKNVGIPLLEGYGLSEASPVVTINPMHGGRKAGSVGRPIPGVTVRILDETQQQLPTGQVGEIAVKGPNVMKGYLNNPTETALTIREGWLLTGDMGCLDEDGFLKIVDRKKDMIIVRGMNVYPKEVEDVLVSHPAVAQAAVVGKEDPHRGETPMAAVILKSGQNITSRELIKFCQEKLADYKLPKRILFVQEFPRNPTGKILKREIVKLF